MVARLSEWPPGTWLAAVDKVGTNSKFFGGSKKFPTDSVAFRLKHMILYKDS